MNGSTRNNLIFILLSALFLVSCNLPAANAPAPAETKAALLWDLALPAERGQESPREVPLPAAERTPTPQLVKAVDFESAFVSAEPFSAAEPVNRPPAGGADAAQWLFFEPAEYSAAPMETLYAAFRNTGTREWNEQYYLEFFAGADPTDGKNVPLDTKVPPEGQAVFRIPIRSEAGSWKACWHLKNAGNESLYEFCYNHGNGEDTNPPKSAENNSTSGSGSSQETFWGFVKRSGKAPAKVSTEELSAEFVSTSPAEKHTFKAYDHVENFSVSFVNKGTETWDPSYSLKFYSGYNWFHTESVSLQQTVEKGETATFTFPIEIIEDNDKWVTCWYLSTPDGRNLSDFCFNYYTRS